MPLYKHWFLICAALLVTGGCSDADPPAADSGVPDSNQGQPEAGADGLAPDKGDDAKKIGDGPAAGNMVTTQQGNVLGNLASGFRSFLGIPYAAPPTGKLRWEPPQAATAWTEARDATKYGFTCPQIPLVGMTPATKQNEDCLTLNVWTPWPLPASKAPVMVWIHGGGFTMGGSATATYNGAKIAQKSKTVLVSLNYRLGPLGFLAHSAIKPGSANFGILDQQAALRWVKQNIAAFGGDPNNVTIFGESAGGMSVGAHLASPASKGLFHRAAIQSGGVGETLDTLTAAQAQGTKLVQKLGCDAAQNTLDCIRGKKADDVIKALPLKAGFFFGTGASWGPLVDGVVLPKQPMTLVKDGKWNKVPLLLGTNKDEGTLFIFLGQLAAMTKVQYSAWVTSFFGAQATKVLAEYPVTGYAKPSDAMSALLADLAFHCTARRAARNIAAAGQPVYRYHFTVTPSGSLLAFLGAFHSAEIPFIFDTSLKVSTAEAALTQQMMGFWTRFAAKGDPNEAGKSTWPSYDKAKDQHLELGLKLTTGSGLRKKKCDFWDALIAGK